MSDIYHACMASLHIRVGVRECTLVKSTYIGPYHTSLPVHSRTLSHHHQPPPPQHPLLLLPRRHRHWGRRPPPPTAAAAAAAAAAGGSGAWQRECPSFPSVRPSVFPVFRIIHEHENGGKEGRKETSSLCVCVCCLSGDRREFYHTAPHHIDSPPKSLIHHACHAMQQ